MQNFELTNSAIMVKFGYVDTFWTLTVLSMIKNLRDCQTKKEKKKMKDITSGKATLHITTYSSLLTVMHQIIYL